MKNVDELKFNMGLRVLEHELNETVWRNEGTFLSAITKADEIHTKRYGRSIFSTGLNIKGCYDGMGENDLWFAFDKGPTPGALNECLAMLGPAEVKVLKEGAAALKKKWKMERISKSVAPAKKIVKTMIEACIANPSGGDQGARALAILEYIEASLENYEKGESNK